MDEDIRMRRRFSDDLTGKIVVVMGGTGTIAPEAIYAFLERGATVFATTMPSHENQIEGIRRKVAGLPGKIAEYQLVDVMDNNFDPDAAAAAIKAMIKDVPIDILIQAIGGNTEVIQPNETYVNYSDTAMKKMFDLNFLRPELLFRRLVHQMQRAVSPRLVWILTCSYMGLGSNSLGYACAKAAARELIQSLQVSLTDPLFNPNTRVFGIEPGFLQSEQNANNLKNVRKLEAILDHIPTHRLQDPAAVGELIAQMCTDSFAIAGGSIIGASEGFGPSGMGLGDWTGRRDRAQAAE